MKEGRDPVSERQAFNASAAASAAARFAGVAREWMGNRAPKWSPYYAAMAETTLVDKLFPRMGRLPA